MGDTLTAYVGRDNEERLELLIDGSPVTAETLTGATFKFDSYCLDTDDDPTKIYFLDSDNQTICIKLGLATSLVAGEYTDGKLTVYDAENPNGIAWDSFTVVAYDWDVCS